MPNAPTAAEVGEGNGDPSHPANTEWPEDVIIRRALHGYTPITDATYNRCIAYLTALLAARRGEEAARMRVRALETALVDHAASGAEIERAVKTFRSLEGRRIDFAAMLEVLDEYERNRRTREARPNATRPFPWRAEINGPDDAQIVCGEHGNPSTFAQIAECHTEADARFIVETCNRAALAATETHEQA